MFPNKKYLFFNDGWKDLGKMRKWREGRATIIALHKFCKIRVHVGKEDNELFTFCPKCKIKTKDQ